MGEVLVKPFNQRIRIAILRVSFFFLLIPIFLARPYYDDTLLGELMEQGGLLLVIAAVLGRFWSILYIGGHKNLTVMQNGPYSICRHPLYLFSTLGAVGFGLMLQSLILAVLIGVVIFTILNATASKEETYLRSKFGAQYGEYSADTPRINPALSQFRTDENVSFSVTQLRGNFFDALVFVFLIPLAEFVEWVREVGVFPTFALP